MLDCFYILGDLEMNWSMVLGVLLRGLDVVKLCYMRSGWKYGDCLIGRRKYRGMVGDKW